MTNYLLQNRAEGRSAFGPQSDAAFRSALNAALRVARDNANARGDAVTFDAFRRAVDARIDSQGISAIRADANGTAGGLTGAGALRHVYAQVLEEERPVPNALRIFAVDTDSVALGMKDHEVRRRFTVGDARIWRGGNSQIPTVELSETSKVFQVRYIVSQILWDVFEELAENIANLGRLQSLVRGVRDVIEEFANQITWFGDDANGIYGVLNYPWVTRVSLNGPSGKAYSIEEDLSGVSDTEQYVRELVRLVTAPALRSKGVFAPNRIAWGLKCDAFLSGTVLKLSSAGQPITLKEWFFKTNPYIKSDAQIDVCQELDDAYGDGVSAIVAFRKDLNTLAVVIPGGGIQSLPMVEEGVVKYQPFFMAHGSVIMRRVGDVVVGLVETTPA